MILRASDHQSEVTLHGTTKKVILRGGVIPNITQIATAEFLEGDAIEPHVHATMWEVYLVLAGSMRYRGGEDEDAVVGVGDVVLVPPGTRHSLHPVTAPFRMFYFGVAVDSQGPR